MAGKTLLALAVALAVALAGCAEEPEQDGQDRGAPPEPEPGANEAGGAGIDDGSGSSPAAEDDDSGGVSFVVVDAMQRPGYCWSEDYGAESGETCHILTVEVTNGGTGDLSLTGWEGIMADGSIAQYPTTNGPDALSPGATGTVDLEFGFDDASSGGNITTLRFEFWTEDFDRVTLEEPVPSY